jgi:hypothetical protein
LFCLTLQENFGVGFSEEDDSNDTEDARLYATRFVQ